MNRIIICTAVAASVALAGCASLSRQAEYGYELADAKTTAAGHSMSIFIHPREDVLLVQRAMGAGIAQGAVSGLTWGTAKGLHADPYRGAAAWLLTPVGCEETRAGKLDATSWEIAYRCPDGVDLRALMLRHRDGLRRGEPLTP